MRVGVIDVGSNTIRLLAADVGPYGLEVVHEHRVWARLGVDVAKTGEISAERLEVATEAVAQLAAAARRAGCLRRGDARRLSWPPGGQRRCARSSAGGRLGGSGARAGPRRGGAAGLPGRGRRGRPLRGSGGRLRRGRRFDAARDRSPRPRAVVVALFRYRLAEAHGGGAGRRPAWEERGQASRASTWSASSTGSSCRCPELPSQ